MEEQIEITKINAPFAVAVKVKDCWIVKLGDSKMIADSFGVTEIKDDPEYQALLCKDSIPDATDCKAMTIEELRAFRAQIEESNGEIYIN